MFVIRLHYCDALALECDEYLINIKQTLDKYMKETEEVSVLIPRIKSMLEHMRSILEYCAQDINETYLNKKGKVYFPYGKNQRVYNNSIDKNLPGLRNHSLDIYYLIEDLQDYKRRQKDRFLVLLCALTNENKHNKLSNTRRMSKKQINISNAIVFDNTATVEIKNCTFNGISSGNFKVEHGEIKGDINPLLLELIYRKDIGSYVFADSNKDIVKFLTLSLKEVKKFYQSLYKLM